MLINNPDIEIKQEIQDLISSPPKTNLLQPFSMMIEEEIFGTFKKEISPFSFKSTDFSILSNQGISGSTSCLWIEEEKEVEFKNSFEEDDLCFKVNEEVFFLKDSKNGPKTSIFEELRKTFDSKIESE